MIQETSNALAAVGVATATMNLAMSMAGAVTTASSGGMYGAAYLDTNYSTDFTKTNTIQSVGSVFIANNDIDIRAKDSFNMTGSILESNNSNITITANQANITASENTFQSQFGSKTTNTSISFGNNGLGLSAGYSQSENFILANSYNNSEILAKNGTFNLTTINDTNIKGGNIVANNVDLNIGGDLNLETLQDTYEQQGSSFVKGTHFLNKHYSSIHQQI